MYLNSRFFYFLYLLSPPSPTLTREPSQTDVQRICLKYENCSPEWETVIQDAFNKAFLMASISQNIDFETDPAVKDFFGPSSLNYEYQDQIESVFAHVATFRIGCNPGLRADVECVDCSNNHTGTVAYVKNIQHPGPYPHGNRLEKTSPVFKFCERFFDDYMSLETKVKEIIDHGSKDWKLHLGSYTNQASIVLHEIMHANVLVSAQHGNRSISDIAIQVDDGSGDERYLEVYGPAMCKTLARTVPKRQNTKATFVRNGITSNADSYAQFALAKYVQTKLNGRYPDQPTDSTVAVDGSWRIMTPKLKMRSSPFYGSATSGNIGKQNYGSSSSGKELFPFTVPDYLPKCPNIIASAEYMVHAAQSEAKTWSENF